MFFLLIPTHVFSSSSTVLQMPDNSGRGLWPYNSRLIDNKLFAGGTPFHPQKPENNKTHVKEILNRLKRIGINSIIILHVPVEDSEVKAEEMIAESAGLKTFRMRMNAETVPSPDETQILMELIQNRAYVHCQWGADRTGAIIAKYLRKYHKYTGRQAWEAVITGGSHAGKIGGLKKDPKYAKLLLYFWPEVTSEAPEICEIYKIQCN
ncbi:MAG: dual specificity protein phosphatase family protein [Candidatus Riflebacteria bacterium]|nr:dual specificity protein phosphatase family protein [Candidatus Riflebacteria bacterium]